jgi:hypothetical protein
MFFKVQQFLMLDATTSRKPVGLLTAIAAWPPWILAADLFPAAIAAALPWSTSLVSIIVGLWLFTIAPMIDPKSFYASLVRPASLAPLALVALAAIGMIWTDDSWTVRLQGMSPVFKFAVLPLLLNHFAQSKRGHWVLISFLASCSVLMALSWIVSFAPAWKISATDVNGVPVRNYIDQTQEFTLCVLALAPLLLTQLEKQWRYLAAVYAALSLAFLCNMTFIVVARIALVYWPIMAVVFAIRYRDRKYCLPVLAVATGVVLLSLVASPYMRDRIARTIFDYKLDQQTDIATSSGERLFYWRTAAQAITEAPIFGHGTGSTTHIFAKAAENKTGEWANIVRNPHSQTLYVAMQWGLLGCFVLFSLWYAHFMLFFNRGGYVSWIGLMVVVQNLVSSLLNSHLFDFHEGWLYVIGVGVAGGMLTSREGAKSSEPA